jgi:hypothetical protein
MARKSTGNKFSSIANSTPRNLPFRETLTIEDRIAYDKLSPEEQSGYEQFCIDNVNNNSIEDYLHYSKSKSTPKIVTKATKNTTKPIEQPVEINISETNIKTDITDYNPVQSVQSMINKNLSIEEEAGKNISVYLSAEALNVVSVYMKKHKIKNRSKLIETVLLSVLKE